MIDPVGTAPGVVVPGNADGGGAAGPAARAPADVADGGGDRGGPGGARGAHRVPAGDGADVRPARVRARGHAARRRGGDRAVRRARDHDLPAARRDRDGHPLRAGGRAGSTRSCSGCCASATGATSSPRTARGSTIRWRSCSRAGGSRRRSRARPACWRRGSPSGPASSAYVAGGVVAYANEAKVELLGVDAGLIERHGAVSEPVADAMAEGALARFEADTAVAITGRRRPGRRHRGEARRHRVLERDAGRRARDDAHGPAPGRPHRHPRPLDDGRDAPAAPPVGSPTDWSGRRERLAAVSRTRPPRGARVPGSPSGATWSSTGDATSVPSRPRRFT